MDVPADLPGMGMFDHAIVYVPGKNPIWIDATDRYAQLGQIADGRPGPACADYQRHDRRRSSRLRSTSQDNGLKETREFTLTDNGPANVVEITEPTGIYESGYRGLLRRQA